MVQAVTDTDYKAETDSGVVLTDFGQHGVVLVGCKVLSSKSCLKAAMM